MNEPVEGNEDLSQLAKGRKDLNEPSRMRR